jgi:hypothetical protein
MPSRLMRTAWPLLWLLPVMRGCRNRVAPSRAVGRAVDLASWRVIGLPAFPQFRHGRIDHTQRADRAERSGGRRDVWSDRVRWGCLAAGLGHRARDGGSDLSACRIFIGAALLRSPRAMSSIRRRAGRRRDYGLAMAGVRSLGLLVIVGPDHWTRGVCDESRSTDGSQVGRWSWARACARLQAGHLVRLR